MADATMTATCERRVQRGGVLVVDDEGFVRRAVERMINKLGYDVRSAATGQEAVDAVAEDPHGFSLVVLDMLMPGMDGKETFSQLRSIAPELNVLLSSGFNETDGVHEMMRNGAAGFLQKPYELSLLASELHRLVG
jgi:two-component system, cell cycle sensor histidine kinase and response regulator CckA